MDSKSKDIIYGAIFGDICGSVFEFKGNNAKTRDEIKPFLPNARYTDDTVLTCAVAAWLFRSKLATDESVSLAEILKRYVFNHPFAGYGPLFLRWVESSSLEAFGSFGNGSAMRVSPCAAVAQSLEDAVTLARKSAEVTHNHPEGIKGAEALATAIYLAKTGASKEEIKQTIETTYGYNLSRTICEIRGTHPFDATCQVTVPEAIIAFLEGNSFDEVFERAIWVGGDSDTIADMACAVAAAYYGLPEGYVDKVKSYLSDDLVVSINSLLNN